MDYLRQAVTRNNQGVSILCSGDNDRATEAFQYALTLIQTAVNLGDDEDPLPPRRTEQAKIQPCALNIKSLQCGDTYIFNHVFHIEEESQQNTQDLPEDDQILPFSAAILFNFAIATHQKGMTGCGNTASLAKASKLYKMVYSLLADHVDQDTFNITICLLALNNRAQIHREQCDYHESKACLAQMIHLLHFMDLNPTIIEKSDYEGLLLNTMFLQSPTVAHAA